ncbi:MAG TPA: amidase [Cytophagales bacterium]|nr:amidase [Cytophagales bacterium]
MLHIYCHSKKILIAVGFIISALLLANCTNSREGKISTDDVKGAQNLIGIEFSDQEIDTLVSYLEENRNGYDTMRLFKLDYGVAPALYFDPRPDNFAHKVRANASDYKLPVSVSLPETDEEIAFLTVAQLSHLIKNRKITSTKLTQIYIGRIKKFNDTLQAAVTLTEELAMLQAKKADEEITNGNYRGPLHGIPYGIKDLFSVPGYKTTWGATPYKDQQFEETAAIVQKLEDAGAVLVAKLTSGALARGDVWFGGKTKNPWDLKQGASGSSAGSASATAAGLVAFSIGTETLGSIISPSTRCGVTGLRPSFGSISRAGGMSLSWSMDKAGPICRSAQDCAIVYNIIKGKTGSVEKDRSVIDYPFAFNPPADLSGYKIGYFKHLFDKDTSKVGANNASSLETLKSLGAELVEVTMPDSIPFDVFDIILRAEAGAFFDDLVLEHKDRSMVEQDKGSRSNSLRQSRFITAVEYLQANRHRKILIEKFNQIIKSYDFIVSPTFGRNQSLTTNLTGHPAISIPNGFDKLAHPTSVTLIGNLYDEAPLLEAAYIIQQATDFDEKHPPYFLNKK